MANNFSIDCFPEPSEATGEYNQNEDFVLMGEKFSDEEVAMALRSFWTSLLEDIRADRDALKSKKCESFQ